MALRSLLVHPVRDGESCLTSNPVRTAGSKYEEISLFTNGPTRYHSAGDIGWMVLVLHRGEEKFGRDRAMKFMAGPAGGPGPIWNCDAMPL